MTWYDFTISPFYEITYVYQIVSMAFIAATSLTIAMLIAALNVFIGVQCDILCDNLKYTFNPLTSSGTNLLVCIKHHKGILRFVYRKSE